MPIYYTPFELHPLHQLRFWRQVAEQQEWEREERRHYPKRFERQVDYQRADRQRSARHEACHAIASIVTGGNVGVIALDEDGGYFRAAASDRPPRATEVETETMRYLLAGMKRDGSRPESVFDHMVVELAPYAYETALGLPDCRETCSVDLERARMKAEALTSTDAEASCLWERAFARASEIIARHRHHIEMLGDELARRGRMSGDEVRRSLADAGFQTSATSAGLRYRAGVMTPVQQPAVRHSRREIYASGRRVGWVEVLLDDHHGELGFVAFRLDCELAGWGADLASAARTL
jgi:hypothetical protein